MDEEIWKDVEGYEGYYQVSSLGRVRSVDREIVYSNGKVHLFKGRILIARQDKDGYLSVILSKNNKIKGYRVHRLVAQAFIPNPDNLPCVNHKDETPFHNNVDNLEWCTIRYNTNYGSGIERAKEKLINHPKKSKIVYQYDLNGNLISIYPSTHECGRLGFNRGHVGECCNGKEKTHKGYIWRYEPL